MKTGMIVFNSVFLVLNLVMFDVNWRRDDLTMSAISAIGVILNLVCLLSWSL